MKLLNAVSIQMFEFNKKPIKLMLTPIEVERAKAIMIKEPVESAIGHEDTAHVLSDLLGIKVPANRVSILLQPGETALVAQYVGPRLPAGATTLPEGAHIDFFLLDVEA